MSANPIQSPAAFVPARAAAFADIDGSAISVSASAPLPVALAAGGSSLAVSNFPANQVVSGSVADPNSAAFFGEVVLTAGTADTAPRRALKINCTVAGNVAVLYADGSSGVWPVTIGVQTLPIAITTIVIAGTTATATYANLK